MKTILKKSLCFLAALTIAVSIGCGKKEDAKPTDVDVSEPKLEEQTVAEPEEHMGEEQADAQADHKDESSAAMVDPEKIRTCRKVRIK